MSIVTETSGTVAKVETKEAENKIQNWKLALGIGGLVAVFAAGTVYYVKSKRASARKASRYTVDDYESSVNKWWTFTTRIFGIVRKGVSEFLSRKPQEMTPFPPASVSAESPWDSTSDQEVVLGEESV